MKKGTPLRLLVTAGPTREYLDDVRFVSNASSGRMGCAVARAALARGHEVVLVCGPLEVKPPACRVRKVLSTVDMLDACCEEFPSADAVIMAAAPADFKPSAPFAGKISKDRETLSLELVRTPDILSELSQRRAHQVVVGFALEYRDVVGRARQKLYSKGLDLIVANRPEAIGAKTATVHFLYPDGTDKALELQPKEDIAEHLMGIVERLVRERRRTLA